MIKIVSWNVNSVNARLERLVAFLEREAPDYLCLQELKCADERFPLEAVTRLGYHVQIFGQKAYNGVAVISKTPTKLISKNFGDQQSDESARFIVVETSECMLVNAYVPNGQSIDSEKFPYKLEWLERCQKFFKTHFRSDQKICMVGDFNIAPDDRDVYDPVAWKEHIHCTSIERSALKELMSFGFIDVFRMKNFEAGQFSWWDYREGSFQLNKGLRIDLILATPPLALTCSGVRIDRDERKGEKPSDHAPVIATFSL